MLTQQITLCSGCFSAITYNHLRYLEWASACDPTTKVWLAIASPAVNFKLKGVPSLPTMARMQMLGGLDCIQTIIEQVEDTPEAIIRKLRPARWVKGGDYTVDQLAALPEGRAVLEYGGKIIVAPRFLGLSTTEHLQCGTEL